MPTNATAAAATAATPASLTAMVSGKYNECRKKVDATASADDKVALLADHTIFFRGGLEVAKLLGAGPKDVTLIERVLASLTADQDLIEALSD